MRASLRRWCDPARSASCTSVWRDLGSDSGTRTCTSRNNGVTGSTALDSLPEEVDDPMAPTSTTSPAPVPRASRPNTVRTLHLPRGLQFREVPSEAVKVPDYAAHPYLDPDLIRRDRHALRYFHRLFRDSLRNDWQYSRILSRLLHPMGEASSVEVDERVLASYFDDASRYVSELLNLLPEDQRARYEPLPEVEACSDLRELGRLLFHRDPGEPERARRVRFEAQRKLYLTKLLIQIEHTRMVQDGPRHRRYLIELLDKELWAFTTEVRDEVASYTIDPEQDVRSGDAMETWNFRVRRVKRAIPGGEIEVDIHHFDTRFKRESAGYDYRPGNAEYRVAERTRYAQMKRNRSASILSKMLRKGLNNPNGITDMLGAKFIVESERDVRRLAELLHHVLGGPFFFRNQVDLFRRPTDHGLMNRFSAPDFKTFKEDVDILYRPGSQDAGRSYLFSVETQIFTVESFLQTVHSQAYTSHREYKRRQFVQGVLPTVFPASLYGTPERVADDSGSFDGEAA